jgi:hypothetical protein
MGIIGDFVGDFSDKSTSAYQPLATFPSQAQRFFPREIEVGFWGAVDPYARAYVIIEAGEEFDPTNRTSEFGVELAEAAGTITALPWGFQDKLGLMRVRYGCSTRSRSRPPSPIARGLVNFFGQEGLAESGNELSWVPNLPFYLEGIFGIFNGDNEVAFGSASFRNPLFTGRLRTFLDFGNAGALQVGGSVAAGTTSQGLSDTILGFDAKYKLTPEGWRHPLLTVAGEGSRPGATTRDQRLSIPIPGGVTTTARRRRPRVYVYAGPALPAVAGRPLRQRRVSRVLRAPVGGRAVHRLQALRVSALPAGVQAHALQRGGLRQPRRAGRRAEHQRGAPPGDVHPGRAPLACVLMVGSGPHATLRRVPGTGAPRYSTSLGEIARLLLVTRGRRGNEQVKVVASLPDLKALTEAVGGDLVDVDSLARGTQNPHDIEVRPSLMVKLRRADLLVRNGAGGDPWVEPLLVGAQNAQIFPGAPGYVDASAGVRILAPAGPVDRSRGDVPPGNPHTPGPGHGAQVTQNIAASQRVAERPVRRRRRSTGG